MIKQKFTTDELRAEFKMLTSQILSDDEFWGGGICKTYSNILTQKERDRIEIRLYKLINPLRKKYEK